MQVLNIAIYWFRNDLRLLDNQAFSKAAQSTDFLLPIYIHDERTNSSTKWNFLRVGERRKDFLNASLNDLRSQLRELGSDLIELVGDSKVLFEEIRKVNSIEQIFCEKIQAPEELEQIKELMDLGFDVKSIWQSSMLDPKSLPFDLAQMPNIFTQFRQLIEKNQLRFTKPFEATRDIPPVPKLCITFDSKSQSDSSKLDMLFKGGERRALAHVKQYFDRQLVDSYKETRNQLIGLDYSTKFSPWLALGCISPRSVAIQLQEYEDEFGENDGTYWLWFELLWRDYFRFLFFKFGKRLFHAKGLADQKPPPFDELKFRKWTTGTTGSSLIDAGMRELGETGFLSNRMRQIVSSFWIYEMNGDWQAGAAWFESQLIDFDVYSNQGNWLYISGRGTDPRGGRAFNLIKQANEYDPEGIYQRMWLKNQY